MIEQLTASLKEAQRASEAKGDFLANMSHELRTPLNGIMGLTSLLFETSLDQEQHEYLTKISKASNLLLGLLNDVLDITKIESGNILLEIIPFDLYITVEETAELLSIHAHAKHIEVLTHISPDVPRWIMGDPGKIRQILTNLIGNAIKFTSEGHVLIDIDSKGTAGHYVDIIFSVKDTGIGFDQDKVDSLFQRFTQADASISREYGGTGLGLAITQQLVQAMKGNLSVTSVKGEGACFSFVLPLKIDTSSHAAIDLNTNLESLRILVADESHLFSDIILEQLRNMNIDCDPVYTCNQAIDVLRVAKQQNRPYDIAIIGNGIPPSGAEALGTIIKSNPDTAATILVMVTATGNRGDAGRATQAGYSGYLVTPIRQSQLSEALSAIWSTHKQGANSGLITQHKVAEFKALQHEQVINNMQPLAARVMLAEDNDINQLLARRIFEKMGCMVDIVSNGEEAVQQYQQASYDIIFMDCMMPIMDGFLTTSCIRSLEKQTGKHIPIVAMTANVMKGDRDRCLESGMDDYISKPIRQEMVLEMLEKWTSQKNSAVM